MFERFTDRARAVVMHAQEEARGFDHNYIGTEHILLGLLVEGEGLGGKALTTCGVTVDGVRAELERRIGRGKEPARGHIPFTPRAKKVLELSLRQAMRIKHNYIGTEHVLLGLVQEGEGVAAQILMTLVDGGMQEVTDTVFGLIGVTEPPTISKRLQEIGKSVRQGLSASASAISVSGSEDETRKRLEAIEARLSVIEQLLRRQLGEEEVS